MVVLLAESSFLKRKASEVIMKETNILIWNKVSGMNESLSNFGDQKPFYYI